MILLRTWWDYILLGLATSGTRLLAVVILLVNVALRFAFIFFKFNVVAYWSLQSIGFVAMAIGATLVLRDIARARNGRFDKAIAEDPEFFDKARTLTVGQSESMRTFGTSVVCTDDKLNLHLESSETFINVVPGRYTLPQKLRPFLADCVKLRRPTHNESKVRLMSNVSLETLTSGRGIDVKRTNYFCGVATNEVATCRLSQADWTYSKDELVCSVFDDYVAAGGKLIPLAESALSNHIGITTLVITDDRCIVLQRQGTTLVDALKIIVGASGSADWSDVRRSPSVVDPNSTTKRPTLQNLIRYAAEREAFEEIGVTVGPGRSRTTLTGFARYVHRGGKPEFFAITYLKERYEEIPRIIRVAERKWVREKMKRSFEGDSIADVVRAIAEVQAEFSKSRTAGTSMMMALDSAAYYLQNSGVTIEQLKP